MTTTTWPRPLLFGHRGAPLAVSADDAARAGLPGPRAALPENTMASFERALEDGVSALETDVHRTADGHVVVSHDHDLRRVFGVPLEIRKHSLAEVQRAAPVPTLLDVLRRFPHLPLNVDIKQHDPPMEEPVVRIVEDAGAASRVLLTSFHVDVLRRVRALGYGGPTGLGRDEVLRLLVLPRAALALWRVRGARAQVPPRTGRLRLDTRAFLDKCHALDIAVDYWTINDAGQARALLALGADGIMTDAPALVRAAFVSPASTA